MKPVSASLYVILSLFFGSIFCGAIPEAQARLAAMDARQAYITETQLSQGLSPNSNLVGTADFSKLPWLISPSYPECGASRQDEAHRAMVVADKR
jgi:hypothetical protein